MGGLQGVLVGYIPDDLLEQELQYRQWSGKEGVKV
jgi:hypothetical protein